MKNTFMRILFPEVREQLCSLIFPRRCPVCDEILEPEEQEKGIHLSCERKLYPITGAVCMHCGRPLGKPIHLNENQRTEYYELYASREYCADCKRITAISQARAIFLYKGAIKESMYRFKYANKREYAHYFARQALEYRGEWMKHIFTSNKSQKINPVIIPVPMFGQKERARGYNQAKAFARELSCLTGIPVDTTIVKRVRDTSPQKELNAKERKNNLKNAFQTQKNSVQYSHALVVDDIYTTGATAEAVADELIKIGVRHVYVLSICRGENM